MDEMIVAKYEEETKEIRKELYQIGEGFVRLGYRLKVVEQEELYKEGGYENINEYAKTEFNMSRSNVQRYIAINDNFSEGGNSLELRKEYQGFGVSKLAEMLTMTEDERSLVGKDMTREQIREIKNVCHEKQEEKEEIKEEEPQEEEEQDVAEEFDERKANLYAVVKAYFLGEGKEKFIEFYGMDFDEIEREAMYVMAPSKFKVFKLAGYNVLCNTLGITLMRAAYKEIFKYKEMVEIVRELSEGLSLEDAYLKITGCRFKEESSGMCAGAQVEQTIENTKAEEKKEDQEKKTKTVETETEQVVHKTVTETVEQVPGQQNIDDEEYKEYQPEVVVVDKETGEIIDQEKETSFEVTLENWDEIDEKISGWIGNRLNKQNKVNVIIKVEE